MAREMTLAPGAGSKRAGWRRESEREREGESDGRQVMSPNVLFYIHSSPVTRQKQLTTAGSTLVTLSGRERKNRRVFKLL